MLLEPSSYFGKHVCRPTRRQKSWPTVTPKDPGMRLPTCWPTGQWDQILYTFAQIGIACPGHGCKGQTLPDFVAIIFFLGGGGWGEEGQAPCLFLWGEIFYCRNHNLDKAWTVFKQIFLSQFHTVSLLYCQNYTPGETWCWYLGKYQFYLLFISLEIKFILGMQWIKIRFCKWLPSNKCEAKGPIPWGGFGGMPPPLPKKFYKVEAFLVHAFPTIFSR